MNQVAEVIDERPALMTGKWKSVEENIKYDTEHKDRHSSRKFKASLRDSSSDADNSPHKRVKKRHDSSSEDDKSSHRKTNRHESSDDNSPPRVNKRHDSSSDGNSPITSEKRLSSANKKRQECDSDNSPPRQRTRNSPKISSDSDNSPPRKAHKNEKSDSDNSPPRAKDKSTLTKKTLDGKRAGLQTASSLKSEMDTLRNEEKKRIGGLSSSVSGKGAKTTVRGRLKEKQEEEERRKAKSEISEQVQEQYARWGKG